MQRTDHAAIWGGARCLYQLESCGAARMCCPQTLPSPRQPQPLANMPRRPCGICSPQATCPSDACLSLCAPSSHERTPSTRASRTAPCAGLENVRGIPWRGKPSHSLTTRSSAGCCVQQLKQVRCDLMRRCGGGTRLGGARHGIKLLRILNPCPNGLRNRLGPLRVLAEACRRAC